jgi:hypothetical protein
LKLLIQNPDATAPSPLIAIESFEAQGTLGDLASRTLRFRRVALTGLNVHVPPKRVRIRGSQGSFSKITRSDLFIDELFSEEGNLVIDTETPARLLFHIHRTASSRVRLRSPNCLRYDVD